MTTVVATKGLVAGDTAVDSGNGSVAVQKVARIRGSLWGFAGSTTDALKFLRWVRGGMRARSRPVFEGDEAEFDALQVTPSGIVLWDQDLEPMPMSAEYHAIGSGGDFALGAMDKGASVIEGLLIASRRDGSTRPPFHFITMNGEAWTDSPTVATS